MSSKLVHSPGGVKGYVLNICFLEAIVSLLIEKDIMTRDEIVKRMAANENIGVSELYDLIDSIAGQQKEKVR